MCASFLVVAESPTRSFRKDRLQVRFVEDGYHRCHLTSKRDSETQDGGEARHFQSSLHIANVALGQSRGDRELLLRDAILLTQLAQALSKDLAFRLDVRHRDDNLLLFVVRELRL